MDGSLQQPGPQGDVEAALREIKTQMPDTYRSIQAKAGEIGKVAYGYVRRACAGQPNLFYAIERGRVAGTPFDKSDITADVAQCMVAFKCKSVVIWAMPQQDGAADGPQ